MNYIFYQRCLQQPWLSVFIAQISVLAALEVAVVGKLMYSCHVLRDAQDHLFEGFLVAWKNTLIYITILNVIYQELSSSLLDDKDTNQ
jgi:hypothetical protein